MSARLYKNTLRFRRWSRKSYAGFLTIGRQVTIGRLKGIVADTLLPKQGNLKIALRTFSFSFSDDVGESVHEPPPEDESQLLQILSVYKNTEKYYGDVNLYKAHCL